MAMDGEDYATKKKKLMIRTRDSCQSDLDIFSDGQLQATPNGRKKLSATAELASQLTMSKNKPFLYNKNGTESCSILNLLGL